MYFKDGCGTAPLALSSKRLTDKLSCSFIYVPKTIFGSMATVKLTLKPFLPPPCYLTKTKLKRNIEKIQLWRNDWPDILKEEANSCTYVQTNILSGHLFYVPGPFPNIAWGARFQRGWTADFFLAILKYQFFKHNELGMTETAIVRR